MNRLVITAVGIVAAVGLSALVFIGVNKLYDLTEKRFPAFTAIVGALSGAILFGILWGNRLIDSPVITSVIAAAIGGVTGYLLGVQEAQQRRLITGIAGGAALGVLLGWATVPTARPSIDPVAAVVGVVVGAGLALVLWAATGRKRSALPRVLVGTAIGWLFGAWLAGDLDGSRAEALIVAIVLGALFGGAVGLLRTPGPTRRSEIAVGSRKYIFLGPALFFVGAALVIPLIRTIWLGFLTGNPNELRWTGLSNYTNLFTDPGIITFANLPDMFTSRLFWLAVVLGVLGIMVAWWRGRTEGSASGPGFTFTAGSLTLMAGGGIMLGFALFTSIRGTIPNNLWWIFSVIIFAVSLGLVVAVLADRSKGENIAKSLIFLPMAISFVGASVIWRLIYVARPAQDPQTGVFNALWVLIGEWSTSTTASTVIAIVLGLVIVGLLYLAWRGWQADSQAMVGGIFMLIVLAGWAIYRFVGPGIGGAVVSEVTGEVIADPVLFIQSPPWNNFWMMVVFIWIQTGFAMVIFSAAIKAVPTELIEAARIDGATETQTFWRVTVPQIFPTIGVVVTTLIVTVLKVFDIPKVMTNGNFDTQVLANEMWERAFTQLNFGLGSAVAVVLFVGVLPVMYINIRRMQRERLG